MRINSVMSQVVLSRSFEMHHTAASTHLLHTQPGWTSTSWGYHGDDGHKFHGGGRGRPYGPSFGCGDTVGCGLDTLGGKVFFTKNGQFLGDAFEIDGAQPSRGFGSRGYFPVVGIDSRSSVTVNFGARPFAFDLR